MKKLLYIASTRSHIDQFHQPVLDAFRQAGWQVDVAAGENFPLEKRAVSFHNLRTAWNLSRQIRRETYTLVSLHTSLGSFYGRLAILLSGTHPYVAVTSHGFLHRWTEPLFSRMTDLLMVMNEEDYAFAKRCRLAKKLVFIHGMGVDERRFHPFSVEERRAARTALGIPEDAFTLVCIGEFSKRKNQRFIIEHTPPEVWLLFCGDGVLRADCESIAGENARFYGQVADIRPYLCAADAMVSASQSEGLPFSLVEGGLSGLPILASDVKGNHELLTAGYPFSPDDVPGYLQALARLRKDKADQVMDFTPYTLTRALPEILNAYREASLL